MKPFIHVWQRLKLYLLFFLVSEAILRLVLIGREYSNLDHDYTGLIKAMLIGTGFDIAVFTYFVIPLGLFFIFLPRKLQNSKFDKIFSAIAFFIMSYVVLFTCVGEWFFWDKFQSRYNFIAVDYLVYTQEVIGNIRESYPIGLLTTGITRSSFGCR